MVTAPTLKNYSLLRFDVKELSGIEFSNSVVQLALHNFNLNI